MNKIKITMIGGGRRSEYYMHCANALPEVFEVENVYLRDAEKAKDYAKRLAVPTTSNLDDILNSDCDYVIVALPRKIALEYIEILYKANKAVFCETPPGASVEEFAELWELTQKMNGKIQVTEQYFEWPLFGAWLKAVDDGLIGEVSNISISAIHGYHAMNIIRRFLGLKGENCTAIGKLYKFPVAVTSENEDGTIRCEVKDAPRQTVNFEFENGKVAFYDFANIQYSSQIRTRQLNVQGTRGEIDDLTIRFLDENNEYIKQDLIRNDMGENTIRGFAHVGVTLMGKYFYKNKFPEARLNDDEVSIATIMYHMKEYVDTGKEFYSLKDALQDSYFSLMIDKALANPQTEIKTETQVWYK